MYQNKEVKIIGHKINSLFRVFAVKCGHSFFLFQKVFIWIKTGLKQGKNSNQKKVNSGIPTFEHEKIASEKMKITLQTKKNL